MAIGNCSSFINYGRRRRIKRQSHESIPDEMWFEILSRLPMDSILTSRSVCKLWRDFSFALENKIENHPLYVPTCALVLLSFTFLGDANYQTLDDVDPFSGYFWLKTGEHFEVKYQPPDEDFEGPLDADFFYPTGFGKGLLRDVSFDFSLVSEINPGGDDDDDDEMCPFVLHGGLLLMTSKTGVSVVNNPATNEARYVPKSPTVEKYGFKHHHKTEVTGLIIQFPCPLVLKRCHYIVVRFCMDLKMMEVYYSATCTWKNYPLQLDIETLSLVNWRYQNYVGFFENGVLSLYVLTNKDHGLAIKFKCHKNSETKQFFFPLPKSVRKTGNARIWECEKSLYLSDFDDTSLCIWKACSTQVEAWSWVSILEISPGKKLCKPAVCEHLSKMVFNASDRVMPLALDPNVPILYLLVNSGVFAYNLNKDTLDSIGVIKNQESRSLEYVHTYVPCLSFLDKINYLPPSLQNTVL